MKLCWFYRKAISWTADAASSAPAWLERHASTCARCRAFRQEETRLVSALLASADAHRTEFPPFLHRRIVSALRSQPDESAQALPGLNWFRAWLTPAVSLAVFMIVGYLLWKPEPGPSVAPFAASVLSVPVTVESPVPDADPKQLLVWTETLNDPLETELTSMVSDAKTALRSLTESFLPNTLLAQSGF